MSMSVQASARSAVQWNPDELGRRTVAAHATALEQQRSRDETELAGLEPARQAAQDRLGGSETLRELKLFGLYSVLPAVAGAGIAALLGKSERGLYAIMAGPTVGMLGMLAMDVMNPRHPTGFRGIPDGASASERTALVRYDELTRSIDSSKDQLGRLDRWSSHIEKDVASSVRWTASFDANGDGKVTIATEGRRGGKWDARTVNRLLDTNGDGDITPTETAQQSLAEALSRYTR